MSLQALLANDRITVQQRAANNRDASGGVAAGGWANVAGLVSVPARVEDQGASTVMNYAMRGMEVDSIIYTQATGIGIGMLVLTSDGRKKLVTGVKNDRSLGSIPNYTEILCSEYRPGA
jgi:hypothetical protein